MCRLRQLHTRKGARATAVHQERTDTGPMPSLGCVAECAFVVAARM